MPITHIAIDCTDAPAPLPKLTRLNVKDFGAKGDDQTDDTDSIQRAINVAGQIYKTHYKNEQQQITVYFPAGVYRI
jgi:polygalacturonase